MESPKKVLLVEDSKEDIELVQRLFKDSSFDVDVASTSTKALRMVEEENFDCVLVDYRLPDQSGLDFIDAIKKKANFRFLPMIMMTGYGDEKLVASALKIGYTDYLSKYELTKEKLQGSILAAIRAEKQKSLDFDRVHDLKIFAHTLAHDMASPLRTILYESSQGVSINSKAFSNDDIEKKFSNIYENAKILSDMVTDLYSVCVTAKDQENEEIDLSRVIEMVVGLVHENIVEKNAKVLLRRKLPLVLGQSALIIRVFQNLIINSIKFASEKRDLVIQIDHEESAVNDEIIITFKDNGSGFKNKKIVSHFNQASNRWIHEQKNMGIGLGICKMAMKHQGGDIKIASTSDEGSVFALTFKKAS